MYNPRNSRYLTGDPIGLAGGINTYTYVDNNPLSYIDPLGLDKTTWWPPGSGRSITDGPRNGNWGGGKWSGGVSGGGTGNAPALDSGDECYQRHGQCFDSGTIKSWVWANGQTYQRSIDGDGRTASYTVGDKLQTISYDNAGRITQSYRALLATPTTPLIYTTSTYAYDHLDRLTNHVINTASPTNSTGYQYDLSGNRTQLNIGTDLYPYTIAADSNRLTAEAGPIARTFTYDAAGNITGDGIDKYTYYNSGRLKQVTRGTTNIYALRYNGLGQFVHRTNGNVYYVYDEAGHLLGEYASDGNPNQETIWLGDTPVLIFRTSSQERIADNNSTVTTAKAVVTGKWATATTIKGYYGSNYYSHVATTSTTDNVIYTITPTATQSFIVYARWVAQASNASNATYTIAPNTAGSTSQVITVNQQQNGGTWNYLGTVNLNTANPMTITLSGQGNGIVVADAVKIVPYTTTATQASVFNIYTDHLNTPREIRNHANQTRWTWYPEQSGAFGAGLPNENPQSLGTFTYNLRFPEQLYDAASQLSYNYFRDYDPAIGRYIQSDPIGLRGGINGYAYVNGNPISRVDPLGLWPMYGNWGGENYSGGKWQSTIPSNPAPPVDAYDACAMQHDYCYAAAQSSQSSNSCPANPPPTIVACDLQLFYCTVAVPSGTGGLVGRVWGTAQGTWALLKAAGGK